MNAEVNVIKCFRGRRNLLRIHTVVGPDNQDLAFGDLDEAQSIDLKKKNEQTETQHMYLQLC